MNPSCKIFICKEEVITFYFAPISVIETTLYSFGGNMETNRFEEYWESFKWTDNIYTAFININHVIEMEGYIKAFEAYVTRIGCIQFLVSWSTQCFLLNFF